MIRNMKQTDWPAVRRIYTQGIEHGLSTFNTSCPCYREWDALHCVDCRFVYEEEGEVLGWIALSPTSHRDCFRGVVEVSVYVDDDHQHRGIGKQLLSHLCTESEKCGYWTLYVAIFSTNEASLALHKSCGFRTIGRREKIAKDKFGEWKDMIIMEKRSQTIL